MVRCLPASLITRPFAAIPEAPCASDDYDFALENTLILNRSSPVALVLRALEGCVSMGPSLMQVLHGQDAIAKSMILDYGAQQH